MIRRSSVLVLVLSLTHVARADVVEDPCACSPNKPGFFRRGTLTGDWNDARTELKDDGIVPQLIYAGEVFSAPGQGLGHPTRVAGLLLASLDLELEKVVRPGLGQAHVSLLGIHGYGLSAELDDVYGISGNVAPQDLRLFEAWVEQPFSKVTLRAGLLSADQEFILAKHSTALLNATFGIISQLSYNVQGITVYPVATPGASARVELPGFTGRLAVFDGDQHGEHGIPDALGPTSLTIGEVELGELLKLGAWHHTLRGNGYYAIVDHQLERYVAGFVRVSVSPQVATVTAVGATPVTSYVDTGIRIGPGPFREHDFIGVGLAFARTAGAVLGDQTVFEATYQAQFGWLTIQPDAQLLLEHTRTAGILATRVTIVF